MATTKITSPELFDLGSLNTALQLPNGTTAERPTSPSTGEWRYNTTTNLVEFWDGGEWRELESEEIPPVPSENFNVVLYTGNGSTQSITGVGFKPDFVWIKPRNFVDNHVASDSTRGDNKSLTPNTTAAEQTTLGVASFDSDGFSLPNWGNVNSNGDTFVAWCWKANGGTTSSNTDGSITSTVQANTKAGFSIVKWTGTGAQGTIGHGLSAAPELIFSKRLDSTNNWNVYQKDLSLSHSTYPDWLYLNLDSSQQNSGSSANHPYYQAPSSTLIYQNTGTSESSNVNGGEYISYCFAPVAGYSKTGTYLGNASQNGPLVNTGFEPALLIVKNTNATANWRMVDNKRNPLNHRQNVLFPNLTNAEIDSTDDAVDFLTNGFKISNDDSSWNANADNFLYIAFAADASSAPTLADSFTTQLFTGNGASNRAITTNFSPSWVWIKNRTVARDHMEFDNVRLLGSELVPGNYTNLDAADFNTTANDFNSFDANGFTVGSGNYTNESGQDMVAWSWKANPLPTINSDGTIQSIVAANQAAGFSIVRYDGNSTAGATVGHGLSAAPETIIIKCMNTGSTNWINYYESIGNSDYLTLNLTNDVDTSTDWFFSNATTFTLNNTFGNANTSGRQYIAYCFDSVAGFSKVGSYTGNGGTQSITGLGFQPSFLLFKKTDANQDWLMVDSARGGQKELIPNSAAAEYTMTNGVSSFDSDGWTMGANNSLNTNAANYVYVAFKENPSPIVPAGQIAYLVVAGAGGGGGNSLNGNQNGGGGGAGGLRTSFGSTSGGGASAESNITLSAQTYTITVGAGGAAGVSDTGRAGNGADSVFSTITSAGGGSGGSQLTAALPRDGGSGGGGSTNGAGGTTGGAGTANQGYAGGTCAGYGASGGGGGGASAVGQGLNVGTGGAGLAVEITGSSVDYAGGGGGSKSNGGGAAGAGGAGGGGNGSASSGVGGVSGTTNTGGGGGGAYGGSSNGGAGGSGVVILRLRTTDYSGTTTGSPTVTTIGEETVLTYTGSGTYVHS